MVDGCKSFPSQRIPRILANLQACCTTRNLQRGKQVHAEAARWDLDSNVYVESALINMYAKCGCMLEACQVFASVKQANVVSWTVLILGYADNGQGLTALKLLKRMRTEGVEANCVTLIAALKACTSLARDGATECRSWCEQVHNLCIECNCDTNIHVQNTLISMYAKCSKMVEARQVFFGLKQPDLVSFNTMILGYAENGEGFRAMEFFKRLRSERLEPDFVTFVAVFKACSTIRGPASECQQRGKQVHCLAVDSDCDSEIKVQNTLIDMYSKCGSMEQARQEFDSINLPDMVSWNGLILGYAENGQAAVALNLFKSMKHRPDCVTFVAALKACISFVAKGEVAECRKRGKQLHDLAVENACDLDIKVQNTLIHMYAKSCGMTDASRVFQSIKQRTVVSWTALILGYADNGQGLVALELFTRMKTEGPAPNSVTFAAALKACGLVGGLALGRRIHAEIGKADALHVVLLNCLVDFYAKCGSLVEAQSVFDSHTAERDVVTWNSLFAGLARCGDPNTVDELFRRMQDAGCVPDSITFLCILTSCNHAGLVQKGKEHFDTMVRKYGIAPTIEHYTCMVDASGRANKLDDAMAWLIFMPCGPNEVTWTAVLDACRRWRNLEIGRLAFQSLFDKDAAAYVLMGQIYGIRGMFLEQEIVFRLKSMFQNLNPRANAALSDVSSTKSSTPRSPIQDHPNKRASDISLGRSSSCE